jgi:dTDP-4-dehydrorhamnose reductase
VTLALLVPGAGGALGTAVLDLVRSARNTFARGLRREDLELTDPFAVQDLVRTWGRTLRADSPDHRLVVINAAAWTDVAAAEADEDSAYAVNAAGPALLAQACAAVGARLLHLSCADVFAGDRASGAAYDVDDAPAPRSAYGRTKLAGEQAVRAVLPDAGYVVRTGWLYGDKAPSPVSALVARAREDRELTVSDASVGSPTSTTDLAAGLLALAAADVPAGTYHCVNSGSPTELALARAVLAELGLDPERAQLRVAAAAPTGPQAAPTGPQAAPTGPQPTDPPAAVLSTRSWDAAGLPARQGWRQALAAALSGSASAH